MIAASPNWRSRSSRRVRSLWYFAKVAARFVDTQVLPIPPLGENTVATLPTRLAPLAEREDDVLRELRKRDHVRDLDLQRLGEDVGALAGAKQDHRGPRVLADRR